MKEYACKYGFENRLEKKIKQQIILTKNNNKLQRYAFKNLLLSLKDLLTYGKLLEERDNKTQRWKEKSNMKKKITSCKENVG